VREPALEPIRLEPDTRPGAPLPHAWIEDEDDTPRAVKDLIGPGASG
jgi:2,4-dichlorophenol 6-monooxygenase